MVIIALLSPVLGAMADHAGIKKKMLAAFMRPRASPPPRPLFFVGPRRLAPGHRPVRARQHRRQRELSCSTSRCCPTSPGRRRDGPRLLRRLTPSATSARGLLLAINLLWISYPHGSASPTPASATRVSFLSVGPVVARLLHSPRSGACPSRHAAWKPGQRRAENPLRMAGFTRLRRDLPRAARLPPGLPDAGRVRPLQRRHPDHHPDGHALRDGDGICPRGALIGRAAADAVRRASRSRSSSAPWPGGSGPKRSIFLALARLRRHHAHSPTT